MLIEWHYIASGKPQQNAWGALWLLVDGETASGGLFIVAPACGISTNERCLRRVEGTDVCVLGTRAYLMRIRLSLTVLSMVIVVATVGWLWLLFKVAAYLLGY
jgi:hypothetical protein